MKNLVIVDLGSNSVRMTINKIRDNGTYQETARFKKDTRLSEGMGNAKQLREPAMERTLTVLKDFRHHYEMLSNLTVKAITTAAVRQAINQNLFLNRVQQEVGLSFDVLTGDEEAYYDYLGVIKRLHVEEALMLDIGGASMELVNIRAGQENNLTSIPFGAVNISEQFNLNDDVTAANLFKAQVFLHSQLIDICWLNKVINKPFVLLGGANRSLARMIRHRQQISPVEQIHGYQMNTNYIFNLYGELLRKNLHDRRLILGLEPERANIIVGGILPLVVLVQMLHTNQVIFSESGVREGLINEYLNEMG